jgi:hypothetical protein
MFVIFFSNAACNYFTFNKVSKWCYLKDGAGVNVINLGFFSTDAAA